MLTNVFVDSVFKDIFATDLDCTIFDN